MNIVFALLGGGLVGLVLKKLISPKSVSKTAINMGRVWAGWTILCVCTATLTPWLSNPNIRTFMAFSSSLVAWPTLAFLLGWFVGYIRIRSDQNAAAPLDSVAPEAAGKFSLSPGETGSDLKKSDDTLYEQIADELESGREHRATWTRAYGLCDGDDKKARATYINLRFEALKTVGKDLDDSSSSSGQLPDSEFFDSETAAPKGVFWQAVAAFAFVVLSILILNSLDAPSDSAKQVTTYAPAPAPIPAAPAAIPAPERVPKAPRSM